MNSRIALITGATAGIGEATAITLARDGYDLIITGRRQERLEHLAETIGSGYGRSVKVLVFDVRDSNQTKEAIHSLEQEWRNISLLVNNAGLAVGRNRIQDGVEDDWERMIDTNVKGLLYVSRAVIPFMKNAENAQIINVGSIAGKETYPGGNVYCATKHAVDALSKSMRLDLLDEGIRVCQISPGAAETEFSLVRFKGDAQLAKDVYKGYSPLLAEDIGETISFAASRPAHVCINDLVVMPAAQGNSTQFAKDNS
jgi:3-hydroxy acid dehydrogenase/malonic semialdehyde reductase